VLLAGIFCRSGSIGGRGSWFCGVVVGEMGGKDAHGSAALLAALLVMVMSGIRGVDGEEIEET
jgi:hypothetical protein